MGRLATFLVRFIELVCTTVVFSLSICAVRWQYRHSVPGPTIFATFAGAYGVMTSLLGLMAAVIGALAGLFMLFIDLLATIFLLAGGIAYALGLSQSDCGQPKSFGTWHDRLINGGCTWNSGEQVWECSFWADSDLVKRCRSAKANCTFMIIGAVVSFGVAIVSLTVCRRKKKESVS